MNPTGPDMTTGRGPSTRDVLTAIRLQGSARRRIEGVAAEPDGDWLNDSTRPLIHAIAPREAAQLALRIAEETDALAARLPLDRLWPDDPDSPISPARGEHRGEHLDEIEAALRVRA